MYHHPKGKPPPEQGGQAAVTYKLNKLKMQSFPNSTVYVLTAVMREGGGVWKVLLNSSTVFSVTPEEYSLQNPGTKLSNTLHHQFVSLIHQKFVYLAWEPKMQTLVSSSS